jgi:hypothetical protein
MDVAAFWMAVAILIYGALLKLQPGLARGWLCICGAAAGGFLAPIAGFFITRLFTSGWTGLAISFWLGLMLMHVGAIIGFLLVLRWTQPPQAIDRPPPEER